MAVIATQNQSLSNWLKMEFGIPVAYCRDEFSYTGTAAAFVPMGTVFGKKTSDGSLAAWNPTATDGTEVAVAINFDDFTATGVSQKIIAMNRGPASISKMGLVVPAGTTAPQYATLRANLEAVGIQVLETLPVETVR